MRSRLLYEVVVAKFRRVHLRTCSRRVASCPGRSDPLFTKFAELHLHAARFAAAPCSLRYPNDWTK